ncbi:TPA: hypothetical protein O5T84_002829, partial [Staphylococcus aureus]|nr:hypothetical protein [Staphylococcus aureus]
MKIPFATNSYKSPSLPISAQRVVNMYAEKQPPDAKTDVAVFGHPGILDFAVCGTGPIRGMHKMGGVPYVVSGQRLYSISSAGVATDIGGSISGTGQVSMDDNGTQLVITNGTNGYLYSATLGFVLISDPDFNAAETVQFFDQRFYFDWKGTNKFFGSDILDGTSYNALVFASAETRPDNVKALVLNKQILLVFNDESIEPWQDIGAANMPLERVPGVVIERGLAAPRATAKQDNTVFFLGEDRRFYRLGGLTPVGISTPAIDAEWQSYSTVSDAYCFSYAWAGHKFVVVHFVNANKTWVYDISTGLWHERESWDINGRSLGRWLGNCHLSCYDKELIGDAYSGRVGYLSASTYTEFGMTTQALATSPPIHADRKRVFISRLEMDIEAGVGISVGQGTDPQWMLRSSKDGGRTYTARQLWKSAGAIGQYRTRLRWLRLGQARERVFELTTTDPVKR